MLGIRYGEIGERVIPDYIENLIRSILDFGNVHSHTVELDEEDSLKIENILNCNNLGIIMKSPYGNHIIQKYITSIHFKEYTKFIYDYIMINFMDIAQTKHGVCVIQKCVSEGEPDQRGKLYDLILQNFDELIKD